MAVVKVRNEHNIIALHRSKTSHILAGRGWGSSSHITSASTVTTASSMHMQDVQKLVCPAVISAYNMLLLLQNYTGTNH